MKRAILGVVAMLMMGGAAEARHHAVHHHGHRHHASKHRVVTVAQNVSCSDPVMHPCYGALQTVERQIVRGTRRVVERVASAAEHMLPHPAGCPRVAFCGCGASIDAFGHSIRSLWLAANWGGFPPAAPASGMAAYRSHHVMILHEHVAGSVWMVYDANSGHHATRYHARDISRYRVVNPHGGNRYANLQ